MDRSHLRLFNPNGSQCEQSTATDSGKPTISYQRVVGEARVAVSVSDLLPLLADAWQSRRAWLGDFSSDRVIVSQDLYEVLLAYKRLNRVA